MTGNEARRGLCKRIKFSSAFREAGSEWVQQQKGRLSLRIKTSWGHRSPPAWAAKPTAEHLHKNSGATSQQVPAAQKSPCNCSWCKNTRLTELTISGSPAKPHKGLPPPSPPQNLPVNIKGHTGMLLSQVQLCSGTGLILMWVILGFG